MGEATACPRPAPQVASCPHGWRNAHIGRVVPTRARTSRRPSHTRRVFSIAYVLQPTGDNFIGLGSGRSMFKACILQKDVVQEYLE